MTRNTNDLTVVARITQARPVIGPRARTRLLTAFLAVNLVMVLLPVVATIGRGLLVPGDLLWHLDASREGGTADRYSGLLFGVVAVLAAVQALRRPAPRGGPRWLWILGWLSAAFFVALVAFEESHPQVDIGSFIAPLLGLKELEERFRWVLVAAPLAVAPGAAAAWVLLSAQRGHPARALLTVLALAVALIGLLLDATSGDLLLYRELGERLDFPPAPKGLYEVFEEGSEQMAAAALVVVFVEMLAAGPGVSPIATGNRRRVVVAFSVTIGLLAASTCPLTSQRVHKGDGWETGAPWSYAGPIAVVKQQFQANQDYLSRIDVWAYRQGGPAGATAEIFARLTPLDGSDRPIRESRAEVRGTRFSNATVALNFEPIPQSSGQLYELTVGVLSGETPYVFLGLTSGETFPESNALVNGAPTHFGDDLAIRTAWIGRFVDGLYPRDVRYWGLFAEIMLNIFLWVLLVVVAWAGVSGHRPYFARRFVWPSVLSSALITADILIVTLTILAIRSPENLA